MKARRFPAPLLLGSALFALAAHAQQPDADARARADALFEEARTLAADGRYTEACPKFAESERLAHGTGTLLNLAECYERLGKTASAYRTFLQAADSATAAGQEERAKLAQIRARVLEPRLASLRIVITAPPAGTRVFREAVEVPASDWGRPVPVDSGQYTVRVETGARVWSQIVSVAGEGRVIDVTVPAFEEPAAAGSAPEPSPAPPSSAPAPAPSVSPSPAPPAAAADAGGGGPPTLSWVLGGAGLVGLAVSGVFGLQAKSKYDASLAHCRSDKLCDAEGVGVRDEALAAGNRATIAFAVGGALLGAATIVWVTSTPAQRPVASARAWVGRDGAGVGVGAAF